VQLDWRLSPFTVHYRDRSRLLPKSLSVLDLVNFRSNEDDTWQSLKGSYHHIGTTRMSTNPKQGVVNEHCQVHGISNLYIAGSSVFPTVAFRIPRHHYCLAVRLADHIKERMGYSAEVTKELEASSTLLPQQE